MSLIQFFSRCFGFDTARTSYAHIWAPHAPGSVGIQRRLAVHDFEAFAFATAFPAWL